MIPHAKDMLFNWVLWCGKCPRSFVSLGTVFHKKRGPMNCLTNAVPKISISTFTKSLFYIFHIFLFVKM